MLPLQAIDEQPYVLHTLKPEQGLGCSMGQCRLQILQDDTLCG